jgi:hypothetical protein
MGEFTMTAFGGQARLLPNRRFLPRHARGEIVIQVGQQVSATDRKNHYTPDRTAEQPYLEKCSTAPRSFFSAFGLHLFSV